MLVTQWGLSGPVILRLSAWGARYLFSSGYRGKSLLLSIYVSIFPSMHIHCCLDAGRIIVDFAPDLHLESLKSVLSRHKHQYVVIMILMDT